MDNFQYPKEVSQILQTLEDNSFEAFAVGGSVRDLLTGKKPNDWDITTNALPDQIQVLFPDSFYNNQFGTVTAKFDQPSDASTKTVEITTYRIESGYSDARRPDKVTFTKTLKEDLARRDFTINAIAIDKNQKITDPFAGMTDLKNKIIKTVGNPDDRFGEDALRMMRAVRLAVQLGFDIDDSTFAAIKKNNKQLKKIAVERIRDELTKIVMSDHPELGFYLLEQSEILDDILPEIIEGVGVEPNKSHVYTVYDHALRSIASAAERNYNFEVRFASLLHDVAKPRTKHGFGRTATFYNHEVLGRKLAKTILTRLKYPKNVINKVAKLVGNHMFYYELNKTTDAGIRRMLRRIGQENLQDQINLRIADRLGMGRPKAVPYRLKLLINKFEEVQKDPITVKMLALRGDELIEELGLKPSPRIGLLLDALLNEVLQDPKLNQKQTLIDMSTKLNKLEESELKSMSPDLHAFENKRKKDASYEKELGLDKKIQL